MPFLLQDAIGSILRWALSNVFGYLVLKHIWTPEQSDKFVQALTGTLLVLLWTLWVKRERLKVLFTALATPRAISLDEAKITAKTLAPALSTPSNIAPELK